MTKTMTRKYVNEVESDYIQRLRDEQLDTICLLRQSSDLAYECCQRAEARRNEAEQRVAELEAENARLKQTVKQNREHLNAEALNREVIEERTLDLAIDSALAESAMRTLNLLYRNGKLDAWEYEAECKDVVNHYQAKQDAPETAADYTVADVMSKYRYL